MRVKNILFLGLLISGIFSCEKNTENTVKNYSFSGKAQKGPFITGTTVTLNELNSSLGQTGRTFTTSITSDDGGFSLNNIELNSNLSLLTANGFYFSELYGKLSKAHISLQAIADLSNKESVNINVLTHLIKGRIEYLVSNGLSYQDANEQAKSEMLTFIGVTDLFATDFESLDISSDDNYNAVLLAISVILQRYSMIWSEQTNLSADLTQLLSNLASDFSTDGIINDQKLIDTLLFNASQLNLIDIRNNIENRYQELGKTVTIPKFETYIAKFQEKYSKNLYTSFIYPDSASPFPSMSSSGDEIPNILALSDTVFNSGPYSIAAIIPLNSSLSIKFIPTGNTGNFGQSGLDGWEYKNISPSGFILNAQKQNSLVSLLFYLLENGGARIEYYENNSEKPTFTKTIVWN